MSKPLNERISDLAAKHAKGRAQSILLSYQQNTLAKNVFIRKFGGSGMQSVAVEHYWAVIVHDGRKTIRTKPGEMPMIWFRDPKKDPRHAVKRWADRPRLTRKQYLRYKASGDLIVARKSGGVGPKPFFSKHLQNEMLEYVPKVAREETANDVVMRLRRASVFDVKL